MDAHDDEPFAQLVRPLIELIRRLTGLETTFVTEIDWTDQRQEVVVALNTGELEVAEGSVLDWSDSMCRWAFLSGKPQSSDVAGDFPGSLGAEALGMRTFFALPIVQGDDTLGTVCGASRRRVDLDPDLLHNVGLIAEALSSQMASHREQEALRRRAERAEALALVDPLTGLANRRAFTARLEEELARSGRRGSPMALLAMDLDCFKEVNDTYGHAAGDAVLVALGEVLRSAARSADVPARLGGDEFALLLPDCAELGARAVAARIAADFAAATASLELPCTVSIGIGTTEASSRRTLLGAADAAMYRSKANGRNRIEAGVA